jgi:CobQ/CobB/MinD/ParA nucleotide binding domain
MNFNDALDEATKLAKSRLADLQEDVILVRDLHGRIRVLLESANPESKPKEPFKKALKALAKDISETLDVYAYSKKDIFLFREDIQSLALPDAASSTVLAEEAGFQVCLHDRLLTGTQWSASPIAETDNPKRFTLFSMKGGVGRSTTAVILAWHLAKKGKRVLVFDLDLESPGVGATLLKSTLPRFGVVDWFVEDALGQGDSVLSDIVVESPLGVGTDGRIAVVPAFGSDTGDYLGKLGRVYLERGPKGHEPWPDRLKRLVSAIEDQEKPDIVLLDSRTGLHDTSAALVLAMGANTLLFAVDSRQTWTAYEFLFQHWKQHPNLREFRNKLWVLGAMVPRKDTRNYVDGLRDSSWKLFLESVYDKPPDEKTSESVFNYAQADEVGNHYPRKILWDEGLTAFDPLETWQDAPVQAAYGAFFGWFDKILLGETEAL